MIVFQHHIFNSFDSILGVPTLIIYPLAIAKILGILAIWLIKKPWIKHLAYLCFAFDLSMAIILHINAGDGKAIGPAVPLVLLVVSYFYYWRKGVVVVGKNVS